MAPESGKSYRESNLKVIVNPITLNPTLQKCSGVFLKPPPAAAMNLGVICTAPVNETIFTFQQGLGMLQSMGLSGAKGEGGCRGGEMGDEPRVSQSCLG